MSSSARPSAYPSGELSGGIALCLSGGGFRALLFHLGALRRLTELGILAKVDTVSSTSGGSLLAARLATLISASGEMRASFSPGAWRELVETPLLALASEDLEAGAGTRRLLPWNWFRPGAAAEALARRLETELTPLRLRDLPASPRFVFCAIDRVWGVPWLYERDRVGDRQAGWAPAPDDASLAQAVAASACFPHSIDGAGQSHSGLEPVWTTHATVLVSEAGALPGPLERRRRSSRRAAEAAAVDAEGEGLRKRRLVSGFATGTICGTFWSISSAPSSYGMPFGYSKELARDVLRAMRTGFGPVSDTESAVLRNHGYLTADAAVRRHTPGLLPRAVPHLVLPSAAWSPADPRIEIRVREAMAESWRRARW